MEVLAEVGNGSSVVVLSSSDEEQVVLLPLVEAVVGASESGGIKKTKKKRRKKGKAPAARGEAAKAEELLTNSDSVLTEENDAAENSVLRKLLRWPRYFDPECGSLQSCFNCGEEGHAAVSCTFVKQKPCFKCGLFGHNAKSCSQCFICNEGGHLSKDCPKKGRKVSPDSKLCLQCGHSGHDMLSCTNDYADEDLKEIRCYTCNKIGHLCCVDFEVSGSERVSCYNCGLVGHTGLGCAKSRGEATASASPSLCYVCGEEGHFARGCIKNKKFVQGHQSKSSTPKLKRKRENKAVEFQSASCDSAVRSSKKKNLHHNNRSVTPRKSSARSRYHQPFDHPGDSTYKKFHVKGSNVKDWQDFSHKKSRVRGGWMVEDSVNSYRSSNSEWSPVTPFTNNLYPRSTSSYGYHHHDAQSFNWRQMPSRSPHSFSAGKSRHWQYGSGSSYSQSSKHRFWSN